MSKIDEVLEGLPIYYFNFPRIENEEACLKREQVKEALSTLRIANDDEVIVPREPSKGMIKAIKGVEKLGYHSANINWKVQHLYKAMIQAVDFPKGKEGEE